MTTLENTIVDDGILARIRGEVGDDMTQDFGLISADTEVLPMAVETVLDPVVSQVRVPLVTGITPEAPTVVRPAVRPVEPATPATPVASVTPVAVGVSQTQAIPVVTAIDAPVVGPVQAREVPYRAPRSSLASRTVVSGHTIWDELRAHPERLGMIALAAVLVCVVIVTMRWVPGVVHEPGSVVTRTVPPAGREPYVPAVPLQHGLTPVHVRKAPKVKRHGTTGSTGATHTPTPSTSGVATSAPSTPGSASPSGSPSHATTPPVTGTPPAHGGGGPSGPATPTTSPSHRTTSPSVTPASPPSGTGTPGHPSGTPAG